MKTTGIVRRIDDLGRVVIPRELRRTLRIREGDPLEIFTGRDGEVIFKKYSLMGSLDDFDLEIISIMEEIIGGEIIITNREVTIGYSPINKSKFCGRRLSAPFIKLIDEREIYVQDSSQYVFNIPIMENREEIVDVVVPISVEGFVEGSVALLNCENVTEEKIRNCQQLAELFVNKIQQ